MSSYMVNHLSQLAGKTVVQIANDARHPPEWGLIFDDGTIAWILCDSEGNGPGFLDIQHPRGEKEAKND